jgi:hypothetical protein
VLRDLLLYGLSVALMGCSTLPYDYEVRRAEYWPLWVKACKAEGGYIYINSPASRPCDPLESCLPPSVDWKWGETEDGKIYSKSLTYQCFRK